jgi:hypothetical protein
MNDSVNPSEEVPASDKTIKELVNPQGLIGTDELMHRFGYHKPTIHGAQDTVEAHRRLRLRFIELADWLDVLLPPGRPKSVAFTELETAAMWCHKALAQQDPISTD